MRFNGTTRIFPVQSEPIGSGCKVENESLAPRYNLYSASYWRSLDDTAEARDAFIERADIRYLLVRSVVSLKSVEDAVAYAQSRGRLVGIFCPGYDLLVAELPDDLFYEAWRQVWQLERPGTICSGIRFAAAAGAAA